MWLGQNQRIKDSYRTINGTISSLSVIATLAFLLTITATQPFSSLSPTHEDRKNNILSSTTFSIYEEKLSILILVEGLGQELDHLEDAVGLGFHLYQEQQYSSEVTYLSMAELALALQVELT